MPINSVGIVTGKDDVLIDENADNLFQKIKEYKIHGEGKIAERLRKTEVDSTRIQDIVYRPFDKRKVYYDPAVAERPREKVMRNFLGEHSEPHTHTHRGGSL